MEDAKCAGADSEKWVTDNLPNAPRAPIVRQRAAFELCRGCRVQGNCADFAERNRVTDVVVCGIPLYPRDDPRNEGIYAQLSEIAMKEGIRKW